MFLILQGKGDLYMSSVLLDFVIPAVVTQILWTHLALPKDAKQQVSTDGTPSVISIWPDLQE